MENLCADLILFNGKIHTLDQTCLIDSSIRKRAFYSREQCSQDSITCPTAVAIYGRRIRAVGDDRTILAMSGTDTRKIDLENRLVLPGFTDTHFHFYEWALNYDNLDLANLKSFSELQKAIVQRAALLKPGQWIIGQGFNESDWPENRMPHRIDLDIVAPDNPVCIWRCDLHLAVANSMALGLAGIGSFSEPSALASGFSGSSDYVIDRDESGIPTGVLKELAPNMIKRVIPPLSEAHLLKNMEKAIAHAHSLGLTGIHDVRLMGGAEGADALGAWQTLRSSGKLKIRCHVTLPGDMTDHAVALGLRTGFGDDYLRVGHLKFFSDGGMGARTAWVTEKYLDGEFGMPLTPIEDIREAALKADRAGLSCMVHAVGDRACREVIRMFADIENGNRLLNRQSPNGIAHKQESEAVLFPSLHIPHRIEHVQMILPEDLKALSLLENIAVSCQPNNMSIDISMIEQCAGKRGKYAYALKSILETGVPMMLSSDAPVADPNPFAGIYSAVTRKRMDGTPEEGWYPRQALSILEAVKGYTLTPAMATGQGDRLGSISKGKLADMVVLDQDIFKCVPEKIAKTKVDITIFDGNVVYTRHE
ncbi:putative metal-dependent hydrolase (TIM-barrel fold family protein) [Desulfamplus magnetovallimortis]|uniref:Putative metal-dependent hydrolase (TIM-barrel fold family protein) n=1 Tax=Desulfamplus magnetovallimortis TaxID=1246637 RepID=A0A1W1H7J7_9BACT|nr:amidohydrolase [Desulfamplus magnetovallimortis]SLM28460.1 putative metal-dependent hydrolase (TIM-barrel fold family protein) [Desulfamplus magnetovallimortis]